ncbi:MAG: type II toxin-antitoxin system RelE/ParE family toxin [Alphaproteobacteria bacterium]
MTGKPVILRARAAQDIDAAFAHYVETAGAQTALSLVDALEAALRHIGQHPAGASQRHGYELGLPGLRAGRARRFPYFVFFVERTDSIDVWRVLHGARDIPARLHEPDPD